MGDEKEGSLNLNAYPSRHSVCPQTVTVFENAL